MQIGFAEKMEYNVGHHRNGDVMGGENKNRRFSMRGQFLLLFGLTLASRIPFLNNGFGVDQDACRVAIAVRQWIASGRYETSRLPGYPAYEFIVSLVIRQGAAMTNLISTLACGVVVSLLYWLLSRMQVRNAFLVALTFAFVPIVSISSVSTIDYLPALAFAMAGFCLVVKDRPVSAGVMLGIAVGCRITSGGFLLAACLYWLVNSDDRYRWRKAGVMSVLCLLVAGVCFLPVFLEHKFGMFSYYWMGYPSWTEVVQTMTVEVWGRWGGLCIIAGLVVLPFMRGGIVGLGLDPARRQLTIASLTVLALYLACFLKLPYEAGYLIPLIPFLFLVAALWVRPLLLGWVCMVMLLAPFVHPGGHGLTFRGPLMLDHVVRKGLDAEADAMVKQVTKLEGDSVVIAVWRWPRLVCAAGGVQVGRVRLIDVPDRQQLEDFRDKKYAIYFLAGSEDYMRKTFGLKLEEFGAKPLGSRGRLMTEVREGLQYGNP